MGFRARLAAALGCAPAQPGGSTSQPQDAADAPEAYPRRVKIEAPEDHKEASASAPAQKRKGRKATGGVTKEQLLQIMMRDREDAQDDLEFEEDPHSVRGSTDKRVKIQAPEDADRADEEDQLPPKRKGRKATGAVTQEQIRAALKQEDTDDEDDDAASAGLKPRSRQVKIVEPEHASKADSSPAPSRRGRKAEYEDIEEDEASPRRGQGRKGTGYVTKQDVKALESERRVKIVVPEAASERQLATKRKSRKATGLVTKVQLMAILQGGDSDSERSDGDRRTVLDGKEPERKERIQVSTDDLASDDEERPQKRSAGRKGTGYVAKRDLDLVQQSRVRFQGQVEESQFGPTMLAAARRRGRKATGAVTKVQLMQAMTAEDSDTKTVRTNPSMETAPDYDDESVPQPALNRPAGRKGTAFVPKAKSEPVSDDELSDAATGVQG